MTITTSTDSLRNTITTLYRKDETECINHLLPMAKFDAEALSRIKQSATQLVQGIRERRKQRQGTLETFLHEYDLSSEEGIALMCLAEALLRIPDSTTIDKLISDKISTAEWEQHLHTSESLFINAATWSLMLTGKVFAPTLDQQKTLFSSLKRFISRAGSSVIRPIVLQGMKIIGKQFVMGATIEEALARAKKHEAQGYRYSYDMLGEAARTQEDAEFYFNSYVHAIETIGKHYQQLDPINGPSVSIKLSALHPRYEFTKHERVMQELLPRLNKLVKLAQTYNMGITIDAEEADRLDLSLEIIEAVFTQPDLAGYEGFGLAVQSYQKRAPAVIDWLIALSNKQKRRLMVRLIKGAYWDAEIKQSQLLGLEGYPVFTRKNSTDVSFIACAKKILAHPENFYPQFGTHNAYSVAAILELTRAGKPFEFQRLHGMGEPLYDQLIQQYPCRIYAPVGSYKDLLGYLVRRLLENGANTSFINRLADTTTPIEKIVEDPVARIRQLKNKPHPAIPLPEKIYGETRENSKGVDLSNRAQFSELEKTLDELQTKPWTSSPLIAGNSTTTTTAQSVFSPSNTSQLIGTVHEAAEEDAEKALSIAASARITWAQTPIAERANYLRHAADLFEKMKPTFYSLLCREGGKHLIDCISEVRETIDYCRYYAYRAEKDLQPQILQGPTGEWNQLSLHGRGTIVCISPWNFPLAIFIGQIVAALVAGNAVIAKPAEQTPLVAAEAIRLLHAAGIPKEVLHLLPGSGEKIGAKLVADSRIDGVMFTGSTETAKIIQKTLANRNGPIIPLIAETGGQNAMIVDSSALPEQVVMDVIQSALNSAGQRCSALRVLYVQEEIAPRLLKMLQGAMAELTLGDPSLLATDIGPVIDNDALKKLQAHFNFMQDKAKLIYQVPMQTSLPGYFFAPCAFELKNLTSLQQEIFGPILHVIRYPANRLDQVLDEIINTGYGLTLGIHSRIDATIKYIAQRMPVGNCYVNRNMIGAVVGVQPFGGEHLSGTGPKAGGPYYLPRLCVERAISINTTASGGNATLVSLVENDL